MTNQTNPFIAFTDNDIVKFANKLLSNQGLSTQVKRITRYVAEGHNYYLAVSTRGATLAIFVSSQIPSVVSVRAIHRVIDKVQPFGFLPNGQATGNLDTLFFAGSQSCHENGQPIHYLYQSDLAVVRRFWENEYAGINEPAFSQLVERRLAAELDANYILRDKQQPAS